MTTTPITLPVITIQHTFEEVINEVREGIIPSYTFWVSCYKTEEPSVHAKLNAELDELNRDLVKLSQGKGGVDMVDISSNSTGGEYTISCKALDIPPTRIVTPMQDYSDPERSNPRVPHRITAFDVSPDRSRFATGFLDGSIYIYPTTPSSPDKTLTQSINTQKTKIYSRPHLSNVTSLKFFPSSLVLLSSGADYTMTILPADLPSSIDSSTSSSSLTWGMRLTPVRTLRGHGRPITSTAMVGVGRNIISSSLDATLKLWDVSSGSVITTINGPAPVLCTSLGGRMLIPPDGEEPMITAAADATIDAREVPETQRSVVYAGLQDGSFALFDLGSKTTTFQSPRAQKGGSAISTIAYSSPQNLLATGTAGGIVTLYDTRALGTPLTSFQRTSASIEDLSFISRDINKEVTGEAGVPLQVPRHDVGLAIATSDGLPYIASVIPEGPAVGAELIGVDCDPVRFTKVREVNQENGSMEVWSASDDGIVRRYNV